MKKNTLPAVVLILCAIAPVIVGLLTLVFPEIGKLYTRPVFLVIDRVFVSYSVICLGFFHPGLFALLSAVLYRIVSSGMCSFAVLLNFQNLIITGIGLVLSVGLIITVFITIFSIYKKALARGGAGGVSVTDHSEKVKRVILKGWDKWKMFLKAAPLIILLAAGLFLVFKTAGFLVSGKDQDWSMSGKNSIIKEHIERFAMGVKDPENIQVPEASEDGSADDPVRVQSKEEKVGFVETYFSEDYSGDPSDSSDNYKLETFEKIALLLLFMLILVFIVIRVKKLMKHEQSTRKNANAYYIDRGIAYAGKSLYDQALKNFDKALKINPDDSFAYLNRGIAHSGKNLSVHAVDDFNKAIRINPSYSEAYYFRGYHYYRKGLYDKAIYDFTKAIELNPKHAEALRNRGYCFYRQGKFGEAITDSTKAVELDQNDAQAYQNRGNAFFRKKEYDKAIADYTRTIELNRKFPKAYYNRGYAYYSKHMHEEAISDFTKAIEANPTDSNAHLSKAECYEKLGLMREAVDAYRNFVRYAPPRDASYVRKVKEKIDKLSAE